MFEGAVGGCAFGFIFALTIAISSLMRCPPFIALRWLWAAPCIVTIGWLGGGFAGIVLARIEPMLWGTLFDAVPAGTSLLRFAWVGGAIDGTYLGIFASLLWFSVAFQERWMKLVSTAPVRGFEVLPSS
jgi:hypothetical protein